MLTRKAYLDSMRARLRAMMTGDPLPLRTPPGEITALLHRLAAGEDRARGDLVQIMYPELKRIAEREMSRERPDHTIQPTALVHEFFLEVMRETDVQWHDRKHFLALAAKAMRRFLIDYARGHHAAKRGGSAIKIQLTDLDIPVSQSLDPVVIGDLLQRLEKEEPRMARVVEMRCFGGMSHAEIAEILNVDERTVKRDWQVARAWLYGHLRK